MKAILKIIGQVRIVSIIGAIVLLVGLITSFQVFDDRWAKAAQLKTTKINLVQSIQQVQKSIDLTNVRLEQKILKDKIDALQERIWQLEDRYLDVVMPNHARIKFRELRVEIISAKLEYKALLQK